MFKGISKQVLAGMIEINEHQYSRDILEIFYHSQSERTSMAELNEKITLMQKSRGKEVDYKEFFDSVERLEELGLIKMNY